MLLGVGSQSALTAFKQEECRVHEVLTQQVHPDVQHLTLEAMNASTSMGELGERLMGPPVVACTCLGIDQYAFTWPSLSFDMYPLGLSTDPLVSSFNVASSITASSTKPPKSPSPPL